MTQVQPIDHASQKYSALDLKTVALLLDVDGTLLDIGPAPHKVDVPKELCRSLERLMQLTGGAVALISGRPLADLDKLFAPVKFSAVGGHGAEMRVEGIAINRGIAPLPVAMRETIKKAVPSNVLIEDKGYSLALHYRGIPVGRDRLEKILTEVSAAFSKETVEILPGKEMLELKRAGTNKGEAVRALMTHKPFAGRMPVFIGDDVTDEAVFAVMPDMGGHAFSVARQFDGLTAIFDSPASVRDALRQLANKPD